MLVLIRLFHLTPTCYRLGAALPVTARNGRWQLAATLAAHSISRLFPLAVGQGESKLSPAVVADYWRDAPRRQQPAALQARRRLMLLSKTGKPDEDGELRRLSGEGRIGCSVGVSLVAPFAVGALAEMECFENGSRSEPDIELHIYSLDGKKIDPGDQFSGTAQLMAA